VKRYCLTLKLRPDANLIAQYKEHHRTVWPEVLKSIRDAGVVDMQIYLLGTQMFMIMDTDDDFSFERKAQMDLESLRVQEWEKLMSGYQDVAPDSDPGSRWQQMEYIFGLHEDHEGVR
jgi:L-rhamnose mutarotase